MTKRNFKQWYRRRTWWRGFRINRKYKNDLSFIIGNSINLYEHQSTWNPNMPLRGLLYFAQQFEGLVSGRGDDIYGKRLYRVYL